jgi:hypothetical protein
MRIYDKYNSLEILNLFTNAIEEIFTNSKCIIGIAFVKFKFI